MRLSSPPNVEKLEAKRKIKGLLKALHHEDPDIRGQAAAALGRLGDRRAVEPLTAALADGAGAVTVEAARALGNISDPRATDPLLEAMQKPAERWSSRFIDERRVAAAEALGRIGDQDAVEALVACLDEDSPVRTPAAGALHRLGWHPDSATAEVSYCVATSDQQRCVELGEAAVDPLLQVLEGSRSSRDRAFAAMTLGKIGDSRAVEPLKSAHHRATEPRRRAEIITALGEIGDPEATDVLIEALSGTRVEAVDALKRIGSPTIQRLVASLDDVRVRDAAAELLDHFGWRPGGPIEGVAFWLARHDVPSCVAIGPEAEPALLDVLNRSSWDDRTFAIEVLGEIGGSDALEPLAALSDYSAAEKAFDEVAVRLVAAGRPLDDPRLELVLDTLRSRTVEPDRWIRGVDDDYKHFDDGWATRGSRDLAGAAVTGERLVASSLSSGTSDRLSDLDAGADTEELLESLMLDLDWHTKGLIASLLVESGLSPDDPRLQATIEDVNSWATMLDEDVEIEPMVMETRRYEHQREAACLMLERLT